jgi:SAM-dependent methyltransferase
MSEKKVVLHVGCGWSSRRKLHAVFRDEGWREVRLDIDRAVAPDIVASLTDMAAVEGASVDAVWSSHNLEHVPAHDVPTALAEFKRVLKPGGFALLTLPDLQRVAELIAEDKPDILAYTSPSGPITPLDMVYGHGRALALGNTFMAHRTGFTARTLGEALVRAGFRQADVWRQGFDLWAVAFLHKRPHALGPIVPVTL